MFTVQSVLSLHVAVQLSIHVDTFCHISAIFSNCHVNTGSVYRSLETVLNMSTTSLDARC